MIFKDNRTYDILKWCVMLAIPALATAYTQLAEVFGWGYGNEVARTATIVCTLLGTLLGISNAQYYKQYPKTPENVYELDSYDVEESSGEEGNG